MSESAIVVIAHNSEAVIGACLDSLGQSGAEIIVVDNASADQTRSEVLRRSGVTLLANYWNRGFAAAANQGIQAAAADYVLLLNPDAELVRGLDALVQECRQPDVAVCGGALLAEDGSPQTGFMVRRFPTPAALAFEVLGINRLWPRNPINCRFRCLDLDANAAAEVEQPAGAFLLVKREAWRKLGGFDEIFHPLWFEDVDYCKRAKDSGCRIRYVPSAAARHKGADSVRQLPPSSREGHWYGNLLTYASKHFRCFGFAAVCGAIVLGSVLRTVFAVFRWRSLKPVLIYGRVIRLAAWFLIAGRGEGVGFSSAVAPR